MNIVFLLHFRNSFSPLYLTQRPSTYAALFPASLQKHCTHIHSSHSSFVELPGYGVTEGCFCPEGKTLLSKDSNICVSECCK